MMGLIGLMLMLLILACSFVFWSISRINAKAVTAIGRLTDAIEVHQVTINALQAYQNQADTIINLESDGKEFADHIKELTEAVKKFCALADTDEEKAWGGEIEKNLGKFNEIYTQEILPRVAAMKKTKDAVEKQKIMDEIRDADGKTDAVLSVIQVDAKKGIDSLVSEASRVKVECQQQARQVKAVLTTFAIAMIVLGLALGLRIVRGVNNNVKRIAEILSCGAEQTVSSASQSLAEGASEQAASLQETSSSLEEMSSMTKNNAESAKNAAKLANTTKAAAEAGAKCMQSMSESMDMIQSSSDEMRKAMGAVKDSNNEVAKIIKTIDEIAFQTNILALNAAVEAARAGEAGMGFAVVADEVRNLAQKSAAAARETTSKIEAAISRTEAGVRVSDKVVGDLKMQLVDGEGAAKGASKTKSANASKSAHGRGAAPRLNSAASRKSPTMIQGTASAPQGVENKTIPMEHDFKDF